MVQVTPTQGKAPPLEGLIPPLEVEIPPPPECQFPPSCLRDQDWPRSLGLRPRPSISRIPMFRPHQLNLLRTKVRYLRPLGYEPSLPQISAAFKLKTWKLEPEIRTLTITFLRTPAHMDELPRLHSRAQDVCC